MLDKLNQWINARSDKVPFDALTGKKINPNDTANHLTYAEALRRSTAYGCLTGFSLQPFDGVGCLDIDNCRNPQTGELNDKVKAILALFPGAYYEVSISGTGIHIWLRCNKALLQDRARKFDGVEFYTIERYIAIGHCVSGDFSRDWTAELLDFVPLRSTSPGPEQLPTAPTLTDAEIAERIGKALANRGSASAAFGSKASFSALWAGDAEQLARFFPSSTGDQFDRSSADAALMTHLAFWLGRDPAAMDRAFRQSALMRPKYDERPDYRASTIGNAIAGCSNIYQPRGTLPTPTETSRPIYTLAEMDQNLVLVAGNYVADLRTKEAFLKASAATVYAACETQILDDKGNPKTVPAFPMWIKSRTANYKQALTWCPDEPDFCTAPDGRSGVNLWRGIQLLPPPPDWQQRVVPYLAHVEYLFPGELERHLYLQWFAHMMRHPGVLPHFGFFHFTPITGTGRGTLCEIMAEVLKGYVVLSCQPEILLGEGFNGPISGKLLATVDEIHVGHGAKFSRIDAIKNMITAPYRVVNEKYGPMSVQKNCLRWFVASNHPDGLAFDDVDRRWITVQGREDRRADGDYSELHRLKHNPLFIASIQELLRTYPLADFNPGMHAPQNAARAAALESMRSTAEKAVREFAETWPGDLATTNDLRNYVASRCNGEIPNDAALNHMIRRAGMRQCDQRLRIAADVRSSVVIVSKTIDRATVEKLSPEDIRQLVNAAAMSFERPNLVVANDYSPPKFVAG